MLSLRKKLKKAGALLSLIACTSAFGGHWILPQVFAWGKMMVTYVEDSSVGRAVVDTFSGRRPCRMCHEIQTAKQSEPTPSAALLKIIKSDPGIIRTCESPLDRRFAVTMTLRPVLRIHLESFSQAPDTPPPRLSS